MIWLALLLLCLLAAAAAVLARLAAGRESVRAGLPEGTLLYNDTGRPVGRIAPAEVGREGRRQERPLISEALSLVGRPDYLIEADGGVVPVEVKSTACPAGGRPYDSHVAQLAAYCLLVEEVLGAEVPYGLVKYRDREVRVEYTPELREHALDLIEEMLSEMSASASGEEVHRSHEDPRRCAGCSLRDVCTESLAASDE
jgi:CRISPR-associated exonuclease Cas4